MKNSAVTNTVVNHKDFIPTDFIKCVFTILSKIGIISVPIILVLDLMFLKSNQNRLPLMDITTYPSVAYLIYTIQYLFNSVTFRTDQLFINSMR